MSALGDVTRRKVSGEDLLRTVINEIIAIKNRVTGGKVPPKTSYAYDQNVIYISHGEPTITTTTNLSDTYDSATAEYERSEYS